MDNIDPIHERIDELLRECVQIIEHYQMIRPEDQMYQNTMSEIKVRLGTIKFECNKLLAETKKAINYNI